MTWIIVSNRLPFSKDKKSGELVKASGGLVSAIEGINPLHKKTWLGIAHEEITQEECNQLKNEEYKPVFISPELYDIYYNKISNGVLWPIFHYEGSLIQFSRREWEKYIEVNRIIAENIALVADEKDLIWIHDFHFFLVPRFLRELRPELKTGFFLHIPFPSSEVFRQLPSRKEILEGVLESDLIGFQDYSYLRHFCNSCKGLLDLDSNMLFIDYKGRKVNLGVFPVSIDTEKFIKASSSKEVNIILEKYKSEKNYKYLLLGVDRLDYIKGIIIRLKAFRELLSLYPDMRGEISLLQVSVPTRQDVTDYIELKTKVEILISEINGEFGKPNYVPIQYLYSSVSFNELVALYKLADAALITSRRDGMNLVALEYIASQDEDNPGVVILSEFTGASSVLSHSIGVNPWDIEGTAHKIYYAVKMEKNEKIFRNKQMQKYLKKYNSSQWAESFTESLQNTTKFKQNKEQKTISFRNKILPEELKIDKENELLVFLDYDGTLVPIQNTPEQAVLSSETFELLKNVLKNEKIHIVIVSGRNGDFLTKQFKDLNISIAAEHGAKFYHTEKKEWHSLVLSDKDSWFPSAEKIMNDYSSRVPGSFVEVKEFGLAWHYRLSPSEFGSYQAKKLKDELETGLANLPVTVLFGNKVVEARVIEANKGFFIKWYLETEKNKNETIIAIGDDITDEEMFLPLLNIGINIKVGLNGNSIAKYRFKLQKEVYDFFRFLIIYSL